MNNIYLHLSYKSRKNVTYDKWFCNREQSRFNVIHPWQKNERSLVHEDINKIENRNISKEENFFESRHNTERFLERVHSIIIVFLLPLIYALREHREKNNAHRSPIGGKIFSDRKSSAMRKIFSPSTCYSYCFFTTCRYRGLMSRSYVPLTSIFFSGRLIHISFFS